MTLPATAREKNIKLSLIKHHIDSLETEAGLKILFDSSLEPVSGWDRWVVIHFEFSDVFAIDLPSVAWTVFCCTRNDPEGILQADLKDTVIGFMVDPSSANGIRAIPLYDTSTTPWPVVAHMMIDRIDPGPDFPGTDQTKVSPMTIRARFANTI